MRILLATDTYPPDVNGNARFTKRLAEGLSRRGHEVHVLFPSRHISPSIQFGNIVLHGIPSVPLPGFRPFRVSPAPLCNGSVVRLMERLMPDVVHVHSHLFIGRAAVRAAQLLGLPLIATSHFLPRNLTVHLPMQFAGTRLLEQLCWQDLVRVYNQARLVIGPSETAVKELAARGIKRPLKAMSCGVDLSRFIPGHCSGRTGPYRRTGLTCMYVGRVEREKNIDQLIRAWPLVMQRVDAQLVIIGRGRDLRRCARLVNSLRLHERITFTGYVGDDLLPAAYRDCDVFCNAGIAELQSLAVLDAMAAAKPIIAAAAVALPELVKDGVNGYTFEPGDVLALSERVVDLLSDHHKRVLMGRASLDMARGHDENITLASHEEVYCAVMASGSVA